MNSNLTLIPVMSEFRDAQAAVDALPENEREKISDGYHDFEELYEHRCRLFIALCNALRV